MAPLHPSKKIMKLLCVISEELEVLLEGLETSPTACKSFMQI
jgi:hypothetical protein